MIDETAYAQKYSLGAPTSPFKPVDRSSPGTRLRFTLDKRWAGNDDFDLVAVEAHVRSLGLNLDNATLTFAVK